VDIEKLQDVSSNIPLTNELQLLQSKQAMLDINLRDLGALNAISNFDEKGTTCTTEVMKLIGQNGMEKLEDILSQCKHWLQGELTCPDANPKKLSDDEMLAITLYTFDLKINGRHEENFFFQLNQMLQNRNNEELKLWKGYLYFLQKALQHFDNEKVKVYRGIPKDKANLIEKEYLLGRRILWSAYTSTSNDKNMAMRFAGPQGVVMEINISTGKCISKYSFIKNESEVLLSPNMGFYVSEEVFPEGDHFVVKLVQVSPSRTFVF